MNATLFEAALREKLANRLVLVVMSLVVVVLPVVQLGADSLEGARSLQGALGIVLILAGGSTGREVSSGTLALVFCRPVRRSDFVLTKWLALSLLCSFLSVVQVSVQSLAFVIAHHAPMFADVWQNALERIFLCFGTTAILVALSTFVPKQWDIGLWLLSFVCCAVCASESERLHGVAKAALDVLLPEIPFRHTFHSSPILWSTLFRYAATICVSLCVASWSIGRKELSYGG
jgi:ABC-type transport system involved in multi-copper enzyme maturation permease subunit